MSNDISDTRTIAVAAMALFFVIVLLIGWDLIGDYSAGTKWSHIAIEFLVLLAAAVGIVYLWRQLNRTKHGLGEALADAERWRDENRQLMEGLGVAIQSQFGRWKASNAEAEVGMLLLKGLSHKEIAVVRGTSERTAREQARALYRKAAISGRSALSSFFLEDLLPPTGGGPDA